MIIVQKTFIYTYFPDISRSDNKRKKKKELCDKWYLRYFSCFNQFFDRFIERISG